MSRWADGFGIERGVELFAAIQFLVMGLSHLLRPREWVEFFDRLGRRGSSGAFLNGFLSLSMGSVIAAFHNVWTWPGVVLTMLGWLYIAKSLVIFAAPSYGVRSMGLVTEKTSGRMRAAGVLLIALGLFCGYIALAPGGS